MSVNGGDLSEDVKLVIGAIRVWFRQLILYHRDELKTLVWQLIAIVICTAIVTIAWAVGWEQRGITWHTMTALKHTIPGPPGPAFAAPLGFLFGLVSIFLFDAYKRLQGLLLLGTGLVTMLGVSVFFDRMRLAMTLPTIGVGFLMFVVGLLWGGVLDGQISSGKAEMRKGFQRLITVVAVFGFVGIFEAVINYESPIIYTQSNPSIVAGIEVPATFPEPILPIAIGGFGQTFPTSPIAGIVYLIGLGGLLGVLREFTKYEMEKEVLILGPDRAGKTWLMGGSGYCLQERSVIDTGFEDPDINEPLQEYVEVFRQGNFDNPLLEANDEDQFSFFSFKFEHGILPRRRLRVRTVDYAGEHLKNIAVEDPWGSFNKKWAEDEDKGVDPDEAPDFEKLVELNENGNIDSDDIPSLLSALVAEYDAVATILPGDEFGDHLSDSQLPDHLDSGSIAARLRNRDTAAHNVFGTGYFQVYKRLLNTYDDTDLFFVVTMSDIFLETYKYDDDHNHRDPKGNQNWDAFCKHIFGQVEDKNQRDMVDFMSHSRSRDKRHFYPVYFEPDPSDPVTDNGEFKPNLDWDDDYYPLRGLQYLLKRMGR